MRRGAQKYPYDRFALGQWIRECRESLGWSYRELAQRVLDQTDIRISAATILHAEQGERSLPEAQRNALESTFNALDMGNHIQLYEVATTHTTSSSADPTTLEAASQWDLARDRWRALANLAQSRELWPNWAEYTTHAAMMEMQLGRYEASARLFDSILRTDRRLIGWTNLTEALQSRGWLDMARHDFASAAAHLRTSDSILRRLGMNRTRTFHFLGRTYCAWGIATENASYREFGRRVLMRAYAIDLETQNFPSLGYDLLQQIPSMVHDDRPTARRYLSQSQELLGREAYVVGHFHLKLGILKQYSDPTSAVAHWKQASRAYAQGMFYNNGVSESLRMLSRSFQEERAALPQAAAHALVAAIALPYAESLDLLEEVSAQVFISLCDGVVSRHAAFWREQVERALQMDAPPFALLRTLAARPNGQAQMRWALERAQAAIRNGLPDYLTTREEQVVRHCLVTPDVR